MLKFIVQHQKEHEKFSKAGDGKMTVELIKIMENDIKRCEEAQKSKVGSENLYQCLVGKYNCEFENFEKDMPLNGKTSVLDGFDYRPELRVIKEKLEFLLVTNKSNDPMLEFKTMFENDMKNLEAAMKDVDNEKTSEAEKLQLYKTVTTRYHGYIPKLSDGLYQYFPNRGLYGDVYGKELISNVETLYNKMCTFKVMGYPVDDKMTSQQNTQTVQINNSNTNENKIDINISFAEARKKIESMNSLPENEIGGILEKIEELDKIVHSQDRKNKKWENAKSIIKWVADKGVDVGLTFLPLLMQIQS